MPVLVAALAVVGCGTSQPSAIDESFRYRVGISWSDGFDAPGVDPPPIAYIDGIAAERLELEYGTADDAIGQQHVIELRHRELVVASATITVGSPGSCLDTIEGTAVSASDSYRAYSNGELRYASDGATASDPGGGGHACVGEGACAPRCWPSGGCPGERCTSIYASTDPIATHLDCAPIGDKALDEACMLVTDAAGMHDDCGDQLLCVEGTCRRTCVPGFVSSDGCTVCSRVYGHAPEIGVCE